MKSLNPSPAIIERSRLIDQWEVFKKDYFDVTFEAFLKAIGIDPATHFQNAKERFNRADYYRFMSAYGNNKKPRTVRTASFLNKKILS